MQFRISIDDKIIEKAMKRFSKEYSITELEKMSNGRSIKTALVEKLLKKYAEGG